MGWFKRPPHFFMRGEIYLLTFPNGKVYVGQSKYGHMIRFKQHLAYLNKGKLTPLYRAWRKHGHPEISVLHSGEYTKQQLDELEIREIANRDCMVGRNGYNVSAGGGLSPAEHPVVRKKISEAGKARYLKDDNAKKKNSELRLKHYAEHPETRALLAEKTRKYYSDPSNRAKHYEAKSASACRAGKMNKKPVVGKSKSDGSTISFDSATDAAVSFGKPKTAGKVISACCTGDKKSAYGYTWKYAQA